MNRLRVRRWLVCVLFVTVAAVVQPRRAEAQGIFAKLYEDLKTIFTDLIRMQVGDGVGRLMMKRAPEMCYYLRESVGKLQAGQWGALGNSFKDSFTELVGDLIFFVVARPDLPPPKATAPRLKAKMRMYWNRLKSIFRVKELFTAFRRFRQRTTFRALHKEYLAPETPERWRGRPMSYLMKHQKHFLCTVREGVPEAKECCNPQRWSKLPAKSLLETFCKQGGAETPLQDSVSFDLACSLGRIVTAAIKRQPIAKSAALGLLSRIASRALGQLYEQVGVLASKARSKLTRTLRSLGAETMIGSILGGGSAPEPGPEPSSSKTGADKRIKELDQLRQREANAVQKIDELERDKIALGDDLAAVPPGPHAARQRRQLRQQIKAADTQIGELRGKIKSTLQAIGGLAGAIRATALRARNGLLAQIRRLSELIKKAPPHKRYKLKTQRQDVMVKLDGVRRDVQKWLTETRRAKWASLKAEADRLGGAITKQLKHQMQQAKRAFDNAKSMLDRLVKKIKGRIAAEVSKAMRLWRKTRDNMRQLANSIVQWIQNPKKLTSIVSTLANSLQTIKVSQPCALDPLEIFAKIKKMEKLYANIGEVLGKITDEPQTPKDGQPDIMGRRRRPRAAGRRSARALRALASTIQQRLLQEGVSSGCLAILDQIPAKQDVALIGVLPPKGLPGKFDVLETMTLGEFYSRRKLANAIRELIKDRAMRYHRAVEYDWRHKIAGRNLRRGVRWAMCEEGNILRLEAWQKSREKRTKRRRRRRRRDRDEDPNRVRATSGDKAKPRQPPRPPARARRGADPPKRRDCARLYLPTRPHWRRPPKSMPAAAARRYRERYQRQYNDYSAVVGLWKRFGSICLKTRERLKRQRSRQRMSTCMLDAFWKKVRPGISKRMKNRPWILPLVLKHFQGTLWGTDRRAALLGLERDIAAIEIKLVRLPDAYDPRKWRWRRFKPKAPIATLGNLYQAGARDGTAKRFGYNYVYRYYKEAAVEIHDEGIKLDVQLTKLLKEQIADKNKPQNKSEARIKLEASMGKAKKACLAIFDQLSRIGLRWLGGMNLSKYSAFCHGPPFRHERIKEIQSLIEPLLTLSRLVWRLAQSGISAAKAGRLDLEGIINAASTLCNEAGQLGAGSEGKTTAANNVVRKIRSALTSFCKPVEQAQRLVGRFQIAKLLSYVSKGDFRGVGMLMLTVGMAELKKHSAVLGGFVETMANYVLQETSGGDQTQLAREAFRRAAVKLLASAMSGGVPDGGLTHYKWPRKKKWYRSIADVFIPSLSLRFAYNTTYINRVGKQSWRYLPSVEWIIPIRYAFVKYFGFQVSLLDPIAPIGEMGLRPSGSYKNSWMVGLDAIRPRLDLWLAIPQITRNVAFFAGLGYRPVKAKEVNLDANGDPIDPRNRQFEYGFTGVEGLEFSLGAMIIF